MANIRNALTILPMQEKHRTNASDLNIDLNSKDEESLFKWFLACLLFGRPIQQQVAKRAYEQFMAAGIKSLDNLLAVSWDDLVELLDKGHYVRFDFSTATKLLDVARMVKDNYGSMLELVGSAADSRDLEQRLVAFKGIGATTAEIFLREVAPVWFGGVTDHDFESARRAAEILNNHGFEAYIVGGAVRDICLGKRPKDFDLATDATPEQIAAIPEFTSKYKEPSQAYGVSRVKFANNGAVEGLEIATFRKDIDPHLGRKATRVEFVTLGDDVMRRDFTINALALNPSNNEIVDLVGGLDDLRAGIVRFIGRPAERIAEDPLRIMRAIRFKNQLGFKYHDETEHAIAEAVKNGFVEKIATDRLREELSALLIHPTRRLAVEDLDKFGILQRVLPEVTAGKKTSQPPQYHSEGSVWEHQLLILQYLPGNPSRRLAWAALLHDIGKPPTAKTPDGCDEHLRFDSHYTIGAEMARKILKRLNFSNRDINDVAWMVHYHMAIDDLPHMRRARQLQMLGHPAFEDLLELHRADAAASWRPGKPRGQKPKFAEIERLWREYESVPPEARQPSLKYDLGIDGHWLREKFGDQFELTGQLTGKVLNELNDIYRDEGLQDPEYYFYEARRLLRLYQQSE